MRTLPNGHQTTPTRPAPRTQSYRWTVAAVAVIHLAFVAAALAAPHLAGWLR